MQFISPFSASTYRKRRMDLMKDLARLESNFVCLIWSGSELARNYDTNFSFRATSDFLYLTGFSEPETMLLLQKKDGKFKTSLGVRPRDMTGNRGSEIWEGERVGVERAPKALGVDEAFDIHQTEDVLKKALQSAESVFWSFGLFPQWDQKILQTVAHIHSNNRWIASVKSFRDPTSVLHEMRKIKTSEEIALMKKSADIASEGHIRAMKTTRPGHFEYQIQAEVEREFKKRGAESPSYGSIVASGPNACTLHYHSNCEKVGKNDLILIDAGAEYKGYASDITRCYPASGKFTDAQREVYALVLKSQLAAIKASRPGAAFLAPHHAAVKVLSAGLRKMGILKGSVSQILSKSLWRKYMPHGTSHWLGLDVHDRGIYKLESDSKKDVRLAAGNVLTIEPGLYFRKDDKSVPAKYRGIGVRIEDDVLITKKGNQVLSSYCPKSIEDIERICGPRL